MNSKKIRPKNDTEDLLLSITKSCERLIEQTQKKPQEVLEFKKYKRRKIFPFNTPIPIEGFWMFGLVDLEVYNSVFNITEENNNFELYADIFDEFSFSELEDEVEEILYFSDNTAYHLQHENIGPRIIEAYRKLGLKKSSTDGYIILLRG